jgi:hypothetical protein
MGQRIQSQFFEPTISARCVLLGLGAGLTCVLIFGCTARGQVDSENKSRVRTRPSQIRTTLVAVPGEIDYGRISPGAKSSVKFELANSSAHEVRVLQIETSCTCFTINLPDSRLAPGQSVIGDAQLDLSHERDYIGQLQMRATGRCSFRINDPVAFQLHATAEVSSAGARAANSSKSNSVTSRLQRDAGSNTSSCRGFFSALRPKKGAICSSIMRFDSLFSDQP